MNTQLRTAIIAGSLLIAAGLNSLGQSTFRLNNNAALCTVSPVFGPETNAPWVRLTGNPPTGSYPAGTTVYSATNLCGTNFCAQLFAGVYASPEATLLPGLPIATFRTNLPPTGFVTNTVVTVPGLPGGSVYANVQVRAWDNSSGLYPTWAEAEPAWLTGRIAAGKSEMFSVSVTGDPNGMPPTAPAVLCNLRSFNIYFQAGPPLIAASSVVAVGADFATLSASVFPNSQQTWAWFEVGTNDSWLSSSSPVDLGSNTTVSFTNTIGGLAPGTTYDWRVVATNAMGTVTSSPQSFTTLKPPSVVTTGASSIGSTAATLNGTVNPNGLSSWACCRWGTNGVYLTNYTSWTNLGPGTASLALTRRLTGLMPGATYYFQAYATNSAGSASGNVFSFATLRTNTALSALAISSGSLAPAFSPTTLTYAASVAYETASVTVTPTSADAAATIQIRINGGSYVSVTSGSPSAPLALLVGANTIDVQVMAQDGATKTVYGILVTRSTPPPTDLVAPVITTCATNRVLFANTNPITAPLPDLTVEVAASDDVTPTSSLVIMQSPPAGTMLSPGGITVTLVVSDAAGNQATCEATVVVLPPGMNIVGYVNTTVPPGYSLLSTPLIDPSANASLEGLLFQPPNGSSIIRFGRNGFRVSNYLNGWSDPDLPMMPGDAWFFKNPYRTNFIVTFIGDARSGTNQLPAGLSACSAVIPMAGSLTTTLHFPVSSDHPAWVYLFDNPANGYALYEHDVDFGWLPAEPTLTVGQGFMLYTTNSLTWTNPVLENFMGLGFSQPALTSQVAQVNFFTFNPNAAKGRVFDPSGSEPLDGICLGQLYAGSNATESGFVPLGAPVHFLDSTNAGYLSGGIVSVPFARGNDLVYVQLRAWVSVDGATYESALAGGGAVGKSQIMPLTAHAVFENGPGLAPPDVNTFASFQLNGGIVWQPPFVSTRPADTISQTAATLWGDVIPNGQPTTAAFEWGPTTNYGSLALVGVVGSGDTNVVVSASLTGLQPLATYYYRAVAWNSAGTNYGAGATFTTLANTNADLAGLAVNTGALVPAFDPVKTNYSAPAINQSFVTVTATAADTHATIAVRVNDGPYTILTSGSPSPLLPVVGWANTISVRVQAQDPSVMKVYTITLYNQQVPPAVATFPATDVTATSATLNGSVNPNGFPATAWLEWGTTVGNYPNVVGVTNAGSGTNTIAFGASLLGLSPGVTYHYRAAASNSVAVVRGADQAFGLAGQWVTFRVDMSWQIAHTNFHPGQDVVEARGNFQSPVPWTSGFTLAPNAADTNIYQGACFISNLQPGMTAEYKFVYVHGTNMVWETRENRSFVLVSGGQTLPVVYFDDISGLPIKAAVEFRFNLAAQAQLGAFNPAADQVWVRGNLLGWDAPPSGLRLFADNTQPGLYTNRCAMDNFTPGSPFEFKCTIWQTNGTTLWEGGANRQLTFYGTEPVDAAGYHLRTVGPVGFTATNSPPGDTDGDGLISQAELDTVLSNYWNYSPWVRMTNTAGLGSTSVEFTLTNASAWNFSVLRSTDLQTWERMTNVAWPLWRFEDPEATNAPQRFYRLMWP